MPAVVVFFATFASNMQKTFKTRVMNTTEKEFERLVSEHKSTIYTVCYMFAESAEEADDLFQEVLVNLWKGLPQFDGRSKVSSWIWRLSLNTCISYDRKRRRRHTERLTMERNLYEDDTAEARQIQMLHERIHRLKPFDRAIVLLWLENLSYEEIGSIVGITAKNVSVRLFRIRQELKQMSNN